MSVPIRFVKIRASRLNSQKTRCAKERTNERGQTSAQQKNGKSTAAQRLRNHWRAGKRRFHNAVCNSGKFQFFSVAVHAGPGCRVRTGPSRANGSRQHGNTAGSTVANSCVLSKHHLALQYRQHILKRFKMHLCIMSNPQQARKFKLFAELSKTEDEQTPPARVPPILVHRMAGCVLWIGGWEGPLWVCLVMGVTAVGLVRSRPAVVGGGWVEVSQVGRGALETWRSWYPMWGCVWLDQFLVKNLADGRLVLSLLPCATPVARLMVILQTHEGLQCSSKALWGWVC